MLLNNASKSLNEENGRSTSLWPQGLLDRDSEEHIRKNLLKSDRLEAVIGLEETFSTILEWSLVLLFSNKKRRAPKRQSVVCKCNLIKKKNNKLLNARAHRNNL